MGWGRGWWIFFNLIAFGFWIQAKPAKLQLHYKVQKHACSFLNKTFTPVIAVHREMLLKVVRVLKPSKLLNISKL